MDSFTAIIVRVILLFLVLSLIFKLAVAGDPLKPIPDHDDGKGHDDDDDDDDEEEEEEKKCGNPISKLLDEAISLYSVIEGLSTQTTTTSSLAISPVVTAPCATNDTACLSCHEAIATISYCVDLIPNFFNLPGIFGAFCLCYNPADVYNNNMSDSSLVWVPNEFDGPFSYCPQLFSKAYPTNKSDLAALSSELGFCNSAGNILGVQSMIMGAAMPTVTGNVTGTVSMTAAPSAGQVTTGAQPERTASSEAVGSVKVELMTVISLLFISVVFLQ